MKKLIAMLLVLMMVVALASCGGGGQTTNTSEPAATAESATTSESASEPDDDSLDKNDTASYLGVWKSEHMAFTFNKGGIGRYEVASGFYDFTYEVKDEVVVITVNGGDYEYVASFELNEDGTVLSLIQNGLPSFIEDETEFTKE